MKHQIIKMQRAYSTHSVKPGQKSEARNQPHSGFASMDDGLSDKHPGEHTSGFSQVLLLEIQIKQSCRMAAIICSTKRYKHVAEFAEMLRQVFLRSCPLAT